MSEQRMGIKKENEPKIAYSRPLDGADLEGSWVNGEFEVRFVVHGQVFAGFALCKPSLRKLTVLLNAALEESEGK